jgi:hypothetical protein
MLDDQDLEGTASWAILRAGLDPTESIDPFALAHGLGVRVVRGWPCGCGGILIANDPPIIALRMARSDLETSMRLAHELAHYALIRTGVRGPHDERDAESIAARLLVPSGFVRVECLARGRSMDQLPALIAHLRPAMVIARARAVLGFDIATALAA